MCENFFHKLKVYYEDTDNSKMKVVAYYQNIYFSKD